MLLQHVLDIIESVAPLSYQENWDNSGLQVGNPSANVEAALLTIDLTESVVDEAVSRGCQLIISHHPLLFHGLKQVCGQSDQARCVEKAIRHGIAIYSSHTSMDSWLHGVSGAMADRLGITDYRILVPQGNGESNAGLGVIGDWSGSMTELLEHVRTTFAAPMLRYVPFDKPIRRVALCGGAGAEFIEDAVRAGADVYISADMKYHEMQAVVGRIGLIDMDHWVSEHFTREVFASLLEGKILTCISLADHSPVQVY